MSAAYEATGQIPSLPVLRAGHRELLRRHQRTGASPETLAEIREFVRECRDSGRCLDSEGDRASAQSLVDFWVTRLYRAGEDVVEAGLAEFDETLAPTLAEEACPFLGLDAFPESKHEYFFGRQDLVAKLVDRLRTGNLLAVVGPSGSGKSSLVLAGLVPKLRAGAIPGSEHWQIYPRMVPGSNPPANLARALNAGQAGSDDWVRSEIAAFRANSGRLREVIESRGEPGAVLIIDQFEEVFTLCQDAGLRNAFEENLVRFLQPGGPRRILILTMRSDFNRSMSNLPRLQPLFQQAQEAPTALTPGELRDAIERPAERAGLRIDPRVVDALIQELVGEPAALPLLQFALLRLWEDRTHNRVTWEAYRELGDARTALTSSADTFFDGLMVQEQQTAKRILLRLVRPGTGMDFVANRVRREQLQRIGGDIDAVLNKLIEARLVRLTEGDTPADAEIEVAHEALVRNWQRLVTWLEEERERMSLGRRLEARAAEWVRMGRGRRELLDSFALSEAEHWLASPDADLLGYSEDVPALVRTSRKWEWIRHAIRSAVGVAILGALLFAAINYRQKLQTERNVGQQRETIRNMQVAEQVAEQKRRREFAEEQAKLQASESQRETELERLKRQEAQKGEQAAVAAKKQSDELNRSLGEQRDQIERQRKELARENREKDIAIRDKEVALKDVQRQMVLLRASQLASDAEDRLTGDPELSGILALRAVSLVLALDEDNPAERAQAESALHRAVVAMRTQLVLRVGLLRDMAFSPDGLRLALSDTDGLVQVVDAFTGKEFLSFKAPAGVRALAFSPDGKRLLTGGRDFSAALWDSFSGAQMVVFRGDAPVSAVAFNWDGMTAASGDESGLIRLWDSSSGRELVRLPAGSSPVNSIAFSPDGQRIASAGRDTRVRIWRAASARLLDETDVPTGPVWNIAFSPDGTALAIASGDNSVRIWDLTERTRIRTLVGHTDDVLSVSFSPDGARLASGSADHTVRIWGARSGLPQLTLKGHSDRVVRVSFAPDPSGTRLASVSRDGTVRVWNAGPSKEIVAPIAHQRSIISLSASRDGRKLATGGRDLMARVWDGATHSLLREVPQPAAIRSVSLSADGSQLASVTEDEVVRVWDASSGELKRELKGANKRVWAVGFDPSGTRLAEAGDRSVVVWDVRSGDQVEMAKGGVFRNVKFSPDGGLLATADDRQVRLWKADSRVELASLKGYRGSVVSLAFSAEFLATGGSDGSVRFWDYSGNEKRVLAAHDRMVTSLTFSSDGRRLASAGPDLVTKIWDVPSGRMVLSLESGRVYASAFSADGRRLIAADGGPSARVFLLDTRELVGLALSRLTRNWELRECVPYLDGEDCERATGALKQIIAGNRLASAGDESGARSAYREAAARDPSLQLDPEREAARLVRERAAEVRAAAVNGLLAHARQIARFDQDTAAHAVQEAVARDPALGLNPRAEVERFAREAEAKELADKGQERVLAGDLKGALENFDQAGRLDPAQRVGKSDAERRVADSYVTRARNLLGFQLRQEAVKDYLSAVKLNPSVLQARDWNSLCWYGTLLGNAQDFKSACERAVTLDPGNGSHIDSRGVNRALLGDYEGAIQDFKRFVGWTRDPTQRARRQGYIAALNKRLNPITGAEKKTLARE